MAVHAIEDRPYSAVLGVEQLRVGKGRARVVSADETTVAEISAGDILSIHGQTGDLYIGSRALRQIAPSSAAEPPQDERGPEMKHEKEPA